MTNLRAHAEAILMSIGDIESLGMEDQEDWDDAVNCIETRLQNIIEQEAPRKSRAE